jgi:hypothetical protein
MVSHFKNNYSLNFHLDRVIISEKINFDRIYIQRKKMRERLYVKFKFKETKLVKIDLVSLKY